MKIKMTRAIIKDSEGKKTHSYTNKVIEVNEIEEFRKSLKNDPETVVFLSYEEVE